MGGHLAQPELIVHGDERLDAVGGGGGAELHLAVLEALGVGLGTLRLGREQANVCGRGEGVAGSELNVLRCRSRGGERWRTDG